MDSYKNFVTFTTPTTILKLHKKEADLLRPYFESEMERAMATYEKKYKLKLEKPVQVEVYPDHEDFAVRTLGMPGLGALGVTFGYSVAMDSPSGRKPGHVPLGVHAVARNEPRVHADRDRTSRAALVHRRHGGARRDRDLAGLGRPSGSGRDQRHQEQEAAADRGAGSRVRASDCAGDR